MWCVGALFSTPGAKNRLAALSFGGDGNRARSFHETTGGLNLGKPAARKRPGPPPPPGAGAQAGAFPTRPISSFSCFNRSWAALSA